MIKNILKMVKRVEIGTIKLVENLISGNYRSVFKGRGIEFSEVREYVLGDDIRAIDWNVTARFNTPFVKEFVEERNLNVYLVFDVSSSNEFGYQKSKKEVGLEVAASIMFAALRNNDDIGLCLFTDHIERFIPPKKGKKHVLRILRELIYHEPKSKKTDISKSLTTLNKIIKKRSIVFIISDYLSESFERPLKLLKNKNDIILININDIREEELPDIGYMLIEDKETGEQLVINTSDKNFREFYTKQARKQQELLNNIMKKLKIDIIRIRTDEPFYLPLKKFFLMRKKRR